MIARKNLVLIGMPGAGKSTVGVLAAKALALPFVDVDVALQAREGRRLSALLEIHGHAAFCALEGRFVLEQDWHGMVIATGGSLVYSAAAMDQLAATGFVVYLQASLETLAARLGDLDARGVVRRPGQTLAELHAERHPLYQRYAEATVACDGKTADTVVNETVSSYQAN